ncbi:MAG: gamma-glutamyl-gamma-aminobutyrate hydrolase family protein [Pseudomonadota bacterium]
MTRLLIIDTNSPDLNAAALVNGKLPMGDMFADAMQAIDPGIACQVAEPYDAAPDWNGQPPVDGIIFTGAFVDWNVDAPQAAPIHEAWDWAVGQGVPIWGSCNGMQLAAFRLGGVNELSPHGVEVGLAQSLVPTDHPMMAGRTGAFAAPCAHRAEVTQLPPPAQITARNTHSPVQAMAVQTDALTFWGTQYHPELSTDQIRFWVGISGGVCPVSDDPPDRTLELRNWLALVRACAMS